MRYKINPLRHVRCYFAVIFAISWISLY